MCHCAFHKLERQGADASVRNALIKDIHDSAQPQDASCSLVSRLGSTLHASTTHPCSANTTLELHSVILQTYSELGQPPQSLHSQGNFTQAMGRAPMTQPLYALLKYSAAAIFRGANAERGAPVGPYPSSAS